MASGSNLCRSWKAKKLAKLFSREKINFLRASACSGRWDEMGQRRLSLLLTCDEAAFQCQVSCDTCARPTSFRNKICFNLPAHCRACSG